MSPSKKTLRRLQWSLVVAFVVAVVTAFWHYPKKADVTEYNYLVSALHDLKVPTPENATITRIECEDFEAKAQRYRKLSAYNINRKVDEYVSLCSKVH